jgi:hypothetical protein
MSPFRERHISVVREKSYVSSQGQNCGLSKKDMSLLSFRERHVSFRKRHVSFWKKAMSLFRERHVFYSLIIKKEK